MKITFLLFVAPLLLSKVSAQPVVEWQNTIGGAAGDYLYSVMQTTDGGYFIGGHSGSPISGDKAEASQGGEDYWVMKLDASGNLVWQNTIGGSLYDNLTTAVNTSDGGYLLGGNTNSNISGDKSEDCIGSDDYWVVKLDASGNVVWQNTIGGASGDVLYSLIQTTDGGYLLGGLSVSGISGDKTEAHIGGGDYWVLKLDPSGNIAWQNTIGGSLEDRLITVIQTTDGGYLLGGYSISDISGDKTEDNLGFVNTPDYWVVKLDSSGNILWQNTIGGSDDDILFGNSLIQTIDGGYLMGGYSTSPVSGDKTESAISFGKYDYWVVKLDESGTIIWQNTIGGSNDDYLLSLIQAPHGEYLLGGTSYSSVSGDKTEPAINQSGDYWIVKLDTSGSIIWQSTVGGTDDDQLQSVSQTADGGYLLGGFSGSNISGDKTENSLGGYDYWIIKTTAEWATAVTEFNEPFRLSIYPNPAQDEVLINYFVQENALLTISDLTGREVMELIVDPSHKSQNISVNDLSEGMYIIILKQSEALATSRKLIIRR